MGLFNWSKQLKVFLFLGFLFINNALASAEPGIILKKEPYHLTRGQELRLSFPAVPPDRQIRLSWEARMDYPKQAGSQFHLEVELNGKEVGGMLNRRHFRLLNKPISFKHKTKIGYWYAEGGGWRIVFAPDFSLARRIRGHSGDDYNFVLDVTDLCHREAKNEVVFRNRPVKGPGKLVLRNVSIGFFPSSPKKSVEEGPGLLNEIPVADIQPIIRPEALGIRMGERELLLASRYSLPGGGWAELKGAKDASSKGGQLEHKDFSVERRATWKEDRLVLEETVTNRRVKKPLGLRIEHRLSLAGLRIEEARLGGRPDPSLTIFQSPSNPTLLAQLGDPCVGVVLEDDAMRAQHELIFELDPDQIGWQTHQFALAEGRSYTFQYSIYPVGKGDYFTFINKVRRDWGSPRYVDGPYVLMFDPDKVLKMNPNWLREEIQRLGIKGFGSRVWHISDPSGRKKRLYAFGSGVMSPEFKEYRLALRNASLLIHQLSPDTKVFAYANMHRLAPMANGELEKLTGEIVTLQSGNFFSQATEEYNPIFGMLPCTCGPFGQKFGESVARLIGDLGFDGIYLDESKSPGGNTWTYNRYDELSGDLDPETNEVRATKGSIFLLGLPYRLQFYDWLSKRGLFLLGNGPPPTMVENKLNFPRMVEAHRRAFRAYETHLYTPLAYTTPSPPVEVIRDCLMMGTIPFRVTPGAANNVLMYFFPINVSAIGNGYVVGEERVITAVPGVFSPSKQFECGLLHLFDINGKRSEDAKLVDLTTPIRISFPRGGLAVLVGLR